jgi:hypothetical protein
MEDTTTKAQTGIGWLAKQGSIIPSYLGGLTTSEIEMSTDPEGQSSAYGYSYYDDGDDGNVPAPPAPPNCVQCSPLYR